MKNVDYNKEFNSRTEYLDNYLDLRDWIISPDSQVDMSYRRLKCYKLGSLESDTEMKFTRAC